MLLYLFNCCQWKGREPSDHQCSESHYGLDLSVTLIGVLREYITYISVSTCDQKL